MGLRHRGDKLAVECDCGQRGPKIVIPKGDDPVWSLNLAARDKAAFEERRILGGIAALTATRNLLQ